MEHQFDESSLNETAINDVGTARLALRWALDKIRLLQEDGLRAKQNLQDKTAQLAFVENQLKAKGAEMDKILRSHAEEIKAKQDSLEYQFKSKLDRLGEREKEAEDKIAKQEEIFKQKETKLLDDYQKKSDELRGRWAHIESDLWQMRQEQMLKQQEFEKVYAARLEEERKKAAAEIESARAELEKSYALRVEEIEKRERSTADELKKQEAVLTWAKDSFQQESVDRDKALKKKELEIDKKLMEKNQEIDDYKVKVGLLEKQLHDLPEAIRKRDEDLDRYKKAMESLEGVIRTLEDEKKHFHQDAEAKMFRLNELIDAEKNKYREMEAEIPKRLKIAMEHERNRFAEKLSEVETNYKEDLRRRTEEVDYLERNLKTFEETIKALQTEREAFANKVEQLQSQYSIKSEEFAFREKQLQTEYDVRVRVEIEKHTAALRSEVESAQRIYEDNLRLKITEIAHLRKELETSGAEKIALSAQVNELRRFAESLKEKHACELEAFKKGSRTEYDSRLAAELGEAAARHETGKQKLAASFKEQIDNLNLVAAQKDEEMQKFRTALVKLEEEKRFAIEEERQKGKDAMQSQAAAFRDSARIYEDKILQLNKAIEGLKLEREEMILLERERLERLYSEKEKDFDEQLARKEVELAKFREENIRVGNARDGLFKELEAVTLAKENQDAAYRRALEDFRGKLGEAVSRLESVKNMAEERQARIAELQVELADRKNQFHSENTDLLNRLSYAEKQLRDMKAEYEGQKVNHEGDLLAAAQKFNDAMLKIKETEEAKAEKDRQLDEARREIDLRKADLVKRDEAMVRQRAAEEGLKAQIARLYEESKNNSVANRNRVELLESDLRAKQDMVAQLADTVKNRNADVSRLEADKSRLEADLRDKVIQFKDQFEIERKETRAGYEKLTRDFADREKKLVGEINSLKEGLNARELAAETLQQRLKVVEENYQSARAALDADSAELARYRRMQDEYEKLKKSLEQLKARINIWKKD